MEKKYKAVGYQIVNLGGGKNPIRLNQVISGIEARLNKKAKIDYKVFHRADIRETWADISKAEEALGVDPKNWP